MKIVRHRLRLALTDHIIVVGWRWAMLVGAVGGLLTSHTITLSVVAAVAVALAVAVVVTATVRLYLRAMHANLLLVFPDMLAGLTIIALAGQADIALLPFVYGVVLGPGLVMGWRGGALAGVILGALDILLIRLRPVDPAIAGTSTDVLLVARLLAPALVGALAPLVVRVLRSGLATPARNGAGERRPAVERIGLLQANDERVLRFASVTPRSDAGRERPQANPAGSMPLAMLAAPDAATEQLRRALLASTGSPDVALDVALNQLTAHFSRQSGLDARLSLVGRVRPISPAARGALMKLAQEALLNVQQHARATSVTLTLCYEPHAVNLSVEDDGVGLLDGTHERPGMHGLRAARYRLVELDGAMEVTENTDSGLTVRGCVPLD